MDRFAEIKTFCTVAASGGFSSAARQLGLATSSVTRLVDALEARLGAVLLNRSTRSVTLTDRGRIYYEQSLRVLEQLDAADDSVLDQSSELCGVLRIAAPVTFAAMYLAPIVVQLRTRYPRLLLDLRLSDTAAHLIDESIDVAIRIGSLEHHPNLIARRLTGHERVLCASPAYLAARGTPQFPADLAGHDCLQFVFADNRRIWRMRRTAGIDGVAQADMPVEEIAVQAVIQANNGELLRQAAVNGMGIGMLADWLVRGDLREGRLLRVLAGYQVNPGLMDVGLHALYQSNRRGSQKIRMFVDMLADYLAQPDLEGLPRILPEPSVHG
jgi:DNA-binding transcriptional LysR family regulator